MNSLGAGTGYPLLDGLPNSNDIEFLRSLPARQQPEWEGLEQLDRVREELTRMPALIEWEETLALRDLLAEVAAGRMHVLQAGDCAEDPAECTVGQVSRKASVLDVLAGLMALNSGKPVLRVGRIAGQFGKPRSNPTELVDGVELPVFRGHFVNDPTPDEKLRRADPARLLTGYAAARTAAEALRDRQFAGAPATHAPVWTSHEALLLDYELPMLRREAGGRTVLASTHWPWIGDRTRQVDGAHVVMLAMVANPVACKVGPTMAVDELLALCAQLDPEREPGRLTLISRMGAGNVERALPPLVEAVRAAGHPVAWLCDPMHGNTVTAPNGMKTRLLDVLVGEVRDFQEAVAAAGGVAGGLHLETTPDNVTECATDQARLAEVGDRYTSLCDPRLNPEQAITVASAWCA